MTTELTAKEIKSIINSSFNQALHEKFMYFPETGQLFYRKSGKLAGALIKDGYLITSFKGRNYPVQVLVYYMYHKTWPKGIVDHKNRIRSDNRIANLRDVSVAQNNKNRSPRYNSKSGVSGVYWNRQDSVWKATITYKRKEIFIGHFKNVINAIKARHYAEQKLGYLKDGVISSAQKYLTNAEKMTFVTNINLEEENQAPRDTIESEWEFFCLKNMKKIDKLAEK